MPTHFGQILDPNQPPVPVPQARGQVPGAGIPGQAPGGVTEGPPINQQDREQRVSGWTKFLEQLKTDPSVQQMLIQMGTTLMQGQRPGENFNGLVGRSLQGGNIAGQFIRRNQQQAGQAQQRIDIEAGRAETAADLAESTIATGAETRRTSKQTREQGAEAFPSIQEKRKAETKASQAETVIKEIEADNAKDKSVASIRLINAQAEAEEKLADFRSRSNPTETQTQTLYKVWIDANPTLSLAEVADKFIAHLQLKTRAAMITAAGRIATDVTVPAEERQVFKDWAENALPPNQRKRAPASKPLLPNEARGKIRGAPANQGGGSIATPQTLKDYQDLPSGTRYLNPDGKEKIKP